MTPPGPDGHRRPCLLSGIQPSGHLTIGNYAGALMSWIRLQDSHDCLFLLVDLHAITVPQDPVELRERCREFLALYVACGIDPDRSTIFVQSHVPAHAELAWVLTCATQMGELERMTQFKEKRGRRKDAAVGAGLFTYPALMAADILLYDTALVPVGEDQKQHLELTRDIAVRFNGRWGETFRLPEAFIPPVGARIMSLQDPTKKMSKSDTETKAAIGLLDPPDEVRSKVMKAVTDSGSEVAFDEERRPAISNLLSIYAAFTDEDPRAVAARYTGKGYAALKKDLADILVESLRPIQERYRSLRADERFLETILARGADEARRRAARKMALVHDRLGFLPRPCRTADR